jgi:hypothetical protein
MPSNEVDELYVSLKFRTELQDEIDEILDGVDDLERRFKRSMGTAQDETEDTTGDVQELEGQVQSLTGEVGTLRRKLRRLDGADASVNVDTDDVDADRNVDVDRDRGRLPGELDEVQEAFTFLGSLSPKVKALLGATGAAATALGTAGGLAAVATNLAAQFGDQGIQRDLNGLQRRLKGTANVFAAEFEPLIRQDVIPAVDSLASTARASADDLASFTGAVFSFLGIGEEGENAPQVGGALGITSGGLRRARGEDPASITAGTGLPPAAEDARRRVDKLRVQLLRTADAQEILTGAFQTEKGALQKKIKATKQAIEKAAELGAKLDQQGLAFQQVQTFIEGATADLRDLQSQLDTLQFLDRTKQIQNRIQRQTRTPSGEVEPADPQTSNDVPVPTTEDLIPFQSGGKESREEEGGDGDVENGIASSVQSGFRSGLQSGIQSELQPLFDNIENDFARALINGIQQAVVSKAAAQFTDLLFQGGAAFGASSSPQQAATGAAAAGASAAGSSAAGSTPSQGPGIGAGLAAAGTGAGVGQGVQGATGSRIAGGIAGAGAAALLAASASAGIPLIIGAGLVGGLGGAFASGVRPPVGKPSIVGEEGPELFVPDRSGTIVPNGGALAVPGGESVRPILDEMQRLRKTTERNLKKTEQALRRPAEAYFTPKEFRRGREGTQEFERSKSPRRRRR